MRTSRLSNSLRSFWLALLMLSASAVCAQSVPTDAAQYHYELGITAAERNNYQKALEEFQTSYAIRQVPRLLINIGRAHHRLGNLREAIDVYESYLRIELNAPLSVVIQVKDFLKNPPEGSPTC